MTDLCRVEGLGNAAIATRNGDLQSTETFKNSGGPNMLVGILNDGPENVNVLSSGFSVVAAAATSNEVLKEFFMDLKIEEIIAKILRKCGKLAIPSLYDAIQVLLTADDNRVVASQVYGYARKFAKIGIAESLVDSLCEGLSSPSLVSASIALKSVAINDEICRSVAEVGGIDAVLCRIDDSGEQGNTTAAKACCSLLSKVMSIICTLSLRSPDNDARAVEAGAGDLAIQSMQKFPGAHLLQKNSCLMIRNLVVRNPENRHDFL
ncbi:hypothetical protein LguiB_022161 [Lonicera macranthoides]